MLIIIALCTIISLAFATLVTAQPDTQPLDLRISWTRPTHNTDGTVLTDLAGYYICLSLSEPIPADFPTRDRALMTETCTVVVDITVLDAEAAEHSIQVPVNSEDILYARIAAYDTSGNESDYSDEVCI